jgi:uncharacterized membrane protein
MSWRDKGRAATGVGMRILAAQVSTVEAAGLLHSSASIGPTFETSLLPRTTLQQAGATGVAGALTYGITATMQSFIEAFADRVIGDRVSSPHAKRAVTVAADVVAFGASMGVARVLSQRPREGLWRAAGRTAGRRTASAAAAGAIAVTVDGLVDVASGRHDPGNVHAAVVVATGAALGTAVHMGRTRRLLDTAAETDQYGDPVRGATSIQPAQALAVGSGMSVLLYGMARVEDLVATGLGRIIGWSVPALEPIGKALGHGIALGGLGLGIERGIALAYSTTEKAGSAIEPAYRSHPTSPLVSGGPGSTVDWETIGREGRRFVNMALTAEEISDVAGEPAVDPIRVFVGYESAPSPNSRAYLAMEELERFGAFERPYIVVYSATGSGYVNYVAAESVEFMTGGNVAGVCVQYSVRPSFLSLDRVGTAWETTLALLTALAWKVRSMPADRRPRILLFGESLGSQAAQDVFEKEGASGFDILEVDRALFLGSPYASKWRQRWLADPQTADPAGIVTEVQSAAEFTALDAAVRDKVRVVLLTHNNDPIPKFGPTLAIQQPDWLGDPQARPPGVPRGMRWWPIFTFMLVGIDLLNADNVTPGTFEAYAHDYRKNIPEMVRLAYGLDIPPERMPQIEQALRRREVEWAERRVVAENLDQAEQKIRSTLEEWGVDHSVVPSIVTPKRDAEPDPYAAAPRP